MVIVPKNWPVPIQHQQPDTNCTPVSHKPPPSPPPLEPVHCAAGVQSRREFWPPGSIQFMIPEGKLTLGDRAVIKFTKSGIMPKELFIGQNGWDANLSKMVSIEHSDAMVPVAIGRGGSGSFSVVPIQTGRIQIRVIAVIPCDGIYKETLPVSVRDSTARPSTFFLVGDDYLSFKMPIFLTLSSYPGRRLRPAIRTAAAPDPIRLDQHSVNYRVMKDQGGEVISIDPSNGIIKPVSAGRALIEASYNGVKAYACVIVSELPIDGRYRYNCNDLLPTDVVDLRR